MEQEILNTLYGNWDISIDIDEKMYNRETLIYQLEYCNDENFELISATVSETGMKIQCKTIWGEPVYLESDTEEEKQRKKHDFFDKLPTVENLLIKDEYVLNEKDEIFYTAQSSDSDGGYTQGLNGILTHWQTFNLTKANATDTLTIVFTKGGEWKKTEDEEVIIKLSRVE